MKIERPKVISDLLDFANAGNGVVIGRPGVGKSHALRELEKSAKALGMIRLFLPVDQLGAGTDAEIRAVLHREGDFIQLLREAVSGANAGRAILIFDGFDAARGEVERSGILRLILRAVEELRGLWNVIVSVRQFDARKSERLLALFPPTSTEPRDVRCRSFEVPPLAPAELEQAFAQISRLRELHQQASPELQGLLTIPFNLWLAERILATGTTTETLSLVTSEVQLLEHYWKRRVTNASNREDREFILTTAVRAMVSDHTLTVRRSRVYEPEARHAWAGLLSDELLCELSEGEARIAFSHNILFDFAVCVLMLDDDPAKLAKFVSEEPARPLFLRPSLVYHFTRLWHGNRASFWRSFWEILGRNELHLRQITRLVLPAVVVEEARHLDETRPVLDALNAGDPQAIDAIAFLLQALRVLDSKRRGVWAEFLEACAPRLDQKFAWDAGMIATRLLGTLSPEEQVVNAACGALGRQLLRWAWGQRNQSGAGWQERLAGVLGIPLVAKTYATHPAESRSLLRAVVSAMAEPTFSIECIHHLCNETGRLVPHDPELVAEVYERVFGHEESSDEETNMGGPVMPLISNRRQDFHGCQYVLQKDFSRFLKAAPAPAHRAGIRAVEAFIRQRHVLRYLIPGKTLTDVTEAFRFRGRTAHYTADGSMVWDASQYPEQELGIANAMFDSFEAAAKARRSDEVERFLSLLIENGRAAFFWKRLLAAGSRHPDALGESLWELSIAKPILQGDDCLFELGCFVENATAFLTVGQRSEIEQSILHLPQSATSDETRLAFQLRRDMLLGCIANEFLVMPDARELRKQLEDSGKLRPNRPLFEMGVTSEPYNEERVLRKLGAEPDVPENAGVRLLYAQLQDWAASGRDESKIDELLPIAQQLLSVLQAANAHAQLLLSGWTHLADYANEAGRRTKIAGSVRLRFCREVLLLATAHPSPEPDSESDLKWESACWSPAPRHAAAQGLPWMNHFGHDDEVLKAIERLATDRVPSVRFLLASELWRVGEHSPNTMWKLLERLAAEEPNRVVLKGVAASIWRTIPREKARSLGVVKRLLSRVEYCPDDGGCWEDVVCMVTDFAAWDKEPWAEATLSKWRARPLQSAAELSTSGHRLAAYVQPAQSRTSFEHASELLLAHLDAVGVGLTQLQREPTAVADNARQATWRRLYHVIDEVVTRIYITADIDPGFRQHKEHPLDDITRSRFFRDALPILERVLSFARQPEAGTLFAPTAHRFMEFLNGVVRYDPRLVLRLAAVVVQSSKKFGYNLDSMAMKETVELVERFLADHRSDIQDEVSVNHLLSLLDAFVEVGWPDALSLVWRLDEIYR
jgi:hypothetical protein